jgi:hypothetical protein
MAVMKAQSDCPARSLCRGRSPRGKTSYSPSSAVKSSSWLRSLSRNVQRRFSRARFPVGTRGGNVFVAHDGVRRSDPR